MAWQALNLPVEASRAEELADLLMDLGALSASVEDADAGTESEQPIFGEPGMLQDGDPQYWLHNRLTALFDADADIPAILQQLQQQAGLSQLPPYRIDPVAEQDWVRLTQSQFEPIRISARLWIVPSWHDSPDPDAITLILDPGLAFGTGSHPTTRLCLQWLDESIKGGENLLDYGCGSGILAITAARLGAARVIGIDIDPQAVQASRDNAAQNHVTAAEFGLPDAMPPGEFDIVVANILTNPLKALAPLLINRVRPGGKLVLSGILDSQADEIIALYGAAIDFAPPERLDGWVRLSGTRRSTA